MGRDKWYIKLREAKKPLRCCIYCTETKSVITKHHLVPVEIDSESRASVDMCQRHHKILHRLKTNQELADVYNTPRAIIELLDDYHNHPEKYPEKAPKKKRTKATGFGYHDDWY